MRGLPLLLAAALLAGVGAARAQAGDDDRTLEMFKQWLPQHYDEVAAFDAYLRQEKVIDVAPTWQLLRTASMWRECKAPPFQVPPPVVWPEVRALLRLMQELRKAQVIGPFAVVSAYRDENLNRCAGGSRGSSHMRFAIDIVPLSPTDDQALCSFWRTQGKVWDMGLSRYPSGRIHVDRTSWRTWGADHTGRSSFCFQKAQKRVAPEAVGLGAAR